MPAKLRLTLRTLARDRIVHMARSIVFLIAVSVLGGCQTAYVCNTPACRHKKDLESLAAACIKFVEHTAPVSAVIVSDNLSPDAQRAIALVKSIYTNSAMPKSEKWSIPPGYFLLSSLHANEDDAECIGVLGPALQSTASGYADQCGMRFDIPFEVEDGAWASHSYKITECSSTNVIVPKE